ncbi:hypothetical protein D9M71_742430 [compost metagenome]
MQISPEVSSIFLLAETFPRDFFGLLFQIASYIFKKPSIKINKIIPIYRVREADLSIKIVLIQPHYLLNG